MNFYHMMRADFSQYDWPGNVRVENTLERVVLIHDKPIIESDDIKYILDENRSTPLKSRPLGA